LLFLEAPFFSRFFEGAAGSSVALLLSYFLALISSSATGAAALRFLPTFFSSLTED
jgi:hypothetical protein